MKARLWMPSGLSRAEELAQLPEDEHRAFLDGLTKEEKRRLLFAWNFWQRPKQRIPMEWHGWFTALWLGGRGAGKTRLAAEWLKEIVLTHPEPATLRLAIIGPTSAAVRDVQIEGESGLLSVWPASQRPLYEPSKLKVTFRNGAIAKVYTAEEPERLRGPQHHYAWIDEPATFRDPQKVYDLMVYGLRLGDDPRCLLTGTPLPIPFFNDLLEMETTIFTQASTWENAANLAETTLAYLRTHFEGTDMGRQELLGEILGQNPGSLWRRAWLDAHRVAVAPELRRIVVAIDPSSSASKESCECGLVVVGLGVDGKAYVLADLSIRATPIEWVNIAIKARAAWEEKQIQLALAAHTDWQPRRREMLAHSLKDTVEIVYEANMGGGLIVDLFRLVDRTSLRFLKAVQAVKDKEQRALPISALSQKGMVCMVGTHKKLEEQLTTWIPRQGASPDRIDAMVWGCLEFFGKPEPARGMLQLPGW